MRRSSPHWERWSPNGAISPDVAGASSGHEDLKREVLRGLAGGARLEDLAWAMESSPDRVLALAREALFDFDPELAATVGDEDRRRVGDYLLARQSPGQAAGTLELLERSADARRWAARIRECLEEIDGATPPPVPGPGNPSVADLRRARQARPRGGLAARRRGRQIQRATEEAKAELAAEASPFREEAIEHYQEANSGPELPHYASRPVRLSIYALLALLAGGLVMCALVKVPTHASAKVIVTELGAEQPGPVRGLGMVALFSPAARSKLRTGQALRVRLPDTDESATARVAYVEKRVLSPQAIVERYGLDGSQANRVRSPAAVAVAKLRLPPDAPPRATFAGAVTQEAHVRSGSKRLISLLP